MEGEATLDTSALDEIRVKIEREDDMGRYNLLTKEYMIPDTYTLITEVEIKRDHTFEDNSHEEYEESNTCTLSEEVMDKRKNEEVNNQDIEDHMTPDSNSLLVKAPVLPPVRRNKCPKSYTVSYTIEKREKRQKLMTKDSCEINEIINELEQPKATRSAKIIATQKIANECRAVHTDRGLMSASKTARRLAIRYKNQSPEERAQRLKAQAEYQARKIANETQEQRRERLLKASEYQTRKRANETKRKDQKREMVKIVHCLCSKGKDAKKIG